MREDPHSGIPESSFWKDGQDFKVDGECSKVEEGNALTRSAFVAKILNLNR